MIFMIAAPCAVVVEVGGRTLCIGQIFPGRTSQLDRAGGRLWSVVYFVAEIPRTTRIDDIDDGFRSFCMPSK